jgi:hypothetical protein
MHRSLRILFGVLVAVGAFRTGAVNGEEFAPLVSGEGPEQFTLVGIGPEAITVREGEVRVSGKPNGYFATKGSYKNYVLRFEWMYERPAGLESDTKFRGNSGLLLHIKDHKIWPESIEVQLMYADAGNTFGIPPARFQGRKDAAAQKKAMKPVGEWNAQEVTCKDGAIVVSLNGIEVARGSGARPDHGPIGWQSEGAPIRFRKILINVQD